MPTERLGGAPFFRVDCHREVAGNGWDEPCKSRGLRTVLWAAGGEIPPADPAISQPGTAVSVGACDDLRSLPAAAPSHGRSRLSTRSREGLPDLATGNLRPSSSVMARYRPPIARTRLRIGLTWQCRRAASARPPGFPCPSSAMDTTAQK